ncbi:DUF1810 domain-containing protein [Oceanihabitans sediminis]|uniref:DUF1810 family protein n=1 Tax=Oceanihabitans sediminis TaxID=1812012 RepID=A0A368P5X4_9FLAO|nr:DUF1810 domain-containing protein [Oceanihabitans sediminis]MDX1278338.1 DUF1810 domain-containing protein [Oceanihabitans sediminis]MDX1773343.1 DUF1810 domain-containing protein [Oceanihabitans sediminis]RBP32775.1 uncharacterized protein (DUF1810 family) [Oceanihabitans sediminis]RCU57690.1 DUF1810 family protein [Oceanihabitans sediminis]
MNDEFNLERFIEAQKSDYDRALEEIKNGKKHSHWMWYIFPQYKNLGISEISKRYAIQSKEEALSYFNHPILGKRLHEITLTFLSTENKSAFEILGSPDHFKMKSCMTLFHLAQNETDLFKKVIDVFYKGSLCDKTKKNLN